MICFCKKNKKIEYQYLRVVEADIWDLKYIHHEYGCFLIGKREALADFLIERVLIT